MPKSESAARAQPSARRLAQRVVAPVCAAWVLGLAPLAHAQDDAVEPDLAAEDPVLPLVLGEDDQPDDFAYQTYDALQKTLDFQVDILPPLMLPSIGSPELANLGPDPKSLPIAPITAPKPGALPVIRTVHVTLSESPLTLASLDDRQSLQWRIDGLPSAATADSNLVAPVRPTAVNPQDFSLGASWGAADRIRAPLLDAIHWQAQADLATGATPDHGVRRSLRLTAQWDRPEDLSFSLAHGVQLGGGTAYQHYATGVRASLFDAPEPTRFSGFVELSGEHLALNNLADNLGATVNAGATWRASPSTQLDFSISRGLAPTADMQSNVGLSMHF
jgi:hypothetical protein